jgi:UDP-N-acetylglucosamine:LPS N-acetylglucosamine transferase
LWEQFKQSSLRTVLVCGNVEGETNQTNSGNATKVNFLNSGELESLLNETRMVVCRSGYSSVMDMAAMGKSVIFIPTPRQTEQEYLAERFHKQRIAPFFSQNQFILAEALETAKSYSGFSKSEESHNLLIEAIKSI